MNGVDKPGSVKAQIVKALKAMLNSVQYLSQVFYFYLFIFVLNLDLASLFNKGRINIKQIENMERL